MGDPSEANGGTVIAMTGKQCVAIATDLRQGDGFLTILTNKSKVYKMGDRLLMGAPGLATDATTLVEKMTFRKRLYELRENRQMSPKVFASVLSNVLYDARFGNFFSEPIVAGLDPETNEAFISGMDCIGCMSTPNDYVVSGCGDHCMAGACEAFWEKDMDPETLFNATAQAFLSGLVRDGLSGLGALVYVITPESVTVQKLKARLD